MGVVGATGIQSFVSGFFVAQPRLLQETRHERGLYRRRKRGRPRRSRLAMPRGRADLRNHGAAYGCSWWRPVGYALLGRARCVIAERNGPDVLADECLPFGALAEADLQPTTASVPISRRPSIHKSLSQVQSELGPREGAGRDMADSIAGQEPEFVPCWIGLPLCSGHRSKSMTLTGSLKRNSHEQRTGQQGRRRPLVHRILG